MRSLFVCLATVALLAGCERFAALLPSEAGPGAPRGAATTATYTGTPDLASLPALAQQVAAARFGSTPPIVGRVEFPPLRSLQASIGDVINFATVTLFDPALARAVAATVTNVSGEFSLTLGAWRPDPDVPYVVEATKGLGNYQPGWASPRFRTLVMLNSDTNTWESVSTPSVVIGSQTTAVAIETGLYPNRVRPSLVMGTVDVSVRPARFVSRPVFVAGSPPNADYSGHDLAELMELSTEIMTFLRSDLDPVVSVPEVIPALTGVVPDHGKPNDLVRIVGLGFSPLADGNKVTFNGLVANLLLAKANEIVAEVPAGATTGPVVVESRGATLSRVFTADAAGPAFGIDFVYPDSAVAGATVTILGFGFSKIPEDNTVHFDAATTSCVTVDTNYCTAVVPAAATQGPVFVDVKGVGSSSRIAFSVQAYFRVDTVLPSSGAPNQDIVFLGANFGSATGNVTVGGVSAKVVSWADTQIVASVPFGASSGPLIVTKGTLPPYNAGTFKILSGNITGWAAFNNFPGTSYSHAGGWQGRWRKWLYLGAGYASAGAKQTGHNRTPMERAEIMADGSLGPLTLVPGVENRYVWSVDSTYDIAHQATVIGDYAYAYPAEEPWLGASTKVYQARFFEDGSMSNFAPAYDLPYAVSTWVSSIRVKEYVYVLGGSSNRMQAAKINADGTLQPFQSLAVSVPYGASGGYAVIGKFIYSIGGSATNTIWRIPTKPDGSLDAASWVNVGTMPHTIAHGGVAVIGGWLYLFAGHNWSSAYWNSGAVFRAPITEGEDVSLGVWEQVMTQITGKHDAGIFVNGNKIYITGSYSSNHFPTIEVGTIE